MRTEYDGLQDTVSHETGVFCADESLALDSQREESDINTIVRRFGITGQMPQALVLPTFDDFGEEVFDFQSAQNAIIRARDSFMSIPADVRLRFANDPQRFVEFCSDKANLPELRRMGLAPPEPVSPAPVVVPSALASPAPAVPGVAAVAAPPPV